MENKHVGRLAGRYFKAMAVARGDMSVAGGFVDATRWNNAGTVKAAISAMTTTTVGGSLAAEVGMDFVSSVYPITIIGRMAQLRKIPFDTRLIRQTAGASAYWVSQGAAKPISAAQLVDEGRLPTRKVVGVSIITEELARATGAENILTRDLQAATVAEMDGAFIDPDNAGAEDEKPAAITNGITPVEATSDPTADIKAALTASNGALTSAAWVMAPGMAASLNLRGAPFDQLNALGGILVGLPVITSEACPDGVIALVDQDAIQFGGTGEADLSVATEASVLMDDAPDMSSATPKAATLVSLWQTNSIGLRAEIIVNWRRSRPDGVVVITGAEY